MKKINGVSLFSSAGIAETYFKEIGVDIKVANELLPARANLYNFFYPEANVIVGDISKKETLDKINNEIIKNNCKFLIATPPCQGMSTLGKKNYLNDRRNFFIFHVIEIIEKNDFDYVIIENVPKFLKLLFPYEGEFRFLLDILKNKFAHSYNIESSVLNSRNYGVPQNRMRGFIKMWKRGLVWSDPLEDKKNITLRDCIASLPSLEAGESSPIKWHYARPHNERDILAMKHTCEGKSALNNPVYYPKKINGEAIKGFHNTYKRMKWDDAAPTRAINSGNMGGHNNVHPGRLLPDGTYSDARVLTLRELFIVTSLPPDIDFPEWCTDSFIRTVIGEAIPPKFIKEIIKGINQRNNDSKEEKSLNYEKKNVR